MRHASAEVKDRWVARAGFYWLAQMMRAIHSMSFMSICRGGCAGLSECSSTCLARLPGKDLGHHLAVAGLDHHAVAAPHLFGGRHHNAVAIAIQRQHGIAGDLERVDAVFARPGQLHLVPALAGRKPAASKKPPAPACARPSNGTIAPRECRSELQEGAAARQEGVKALARRVEHFGDALGRRPALAPVLADPLGAIEGRRIEPGQLGEARGREAVAAWPEHRSRPKWRCATACGGRSKETCPI